MNLLSRLLAYPRAPPILHYCNLFIAELEEKAMQSAPLQPSLWLRYVDITFIIWPHGEDNLQTFNAHLNQFSPNVQFTIKMEKEGRLAFLVVLVTRGEEEWNSCACTHHQPQHIDWEGVWVQGTAWSFWKRRTPEAIKIRSEPHTMNLDCVGSIFHQHGIPFETVTSDHHLHPLNFMHVLSIWKSLCG